MAVTNFDGRWPDHSDGAYQAQTYGYAVQPGRAQRILNLSAAVISVSLIVGAVWWGYRIAVRDVSGVPVVRALEGPMRIAPANPGGEEADYQGLAVNTVAADGAAAPVAEQLVLAPRPVDLTLEDGPGLGAETQLASAAPAEDVTAALNVVQASAGNGGPEVLINAAMTEAMAEPTPEAGSASAPARLASDPALATLRPRARPGGQAPLPEVTQTAAVVAELPAISAPEPTDLDPASVPVGTWLVQLGAPDDTAGARALWQDRAVQFPEVMAQKSRILQQGELAGKSFVRVRVQGFAAKSDAVEFCAPLIDKGLTCIPVIVE